MNAQSYLHAVIVSRGTWRIHATRLFRHHRGRVAVIAAATLFGIKTVRELSACKIHSPDDAL